MERSSAEKCLSFININLSPPENAEEGKSRLGERPVITISRQSGAGGMTIADEVANYLNARLPRHGVPWTVFDKNLVQKVIEDHELPEKLAQFMPEDKSSGISDAVEELLGLHPSSWRLIQQTTETVLRIAEMGHAILVGRGANIIASHLPKAFHVRLVGSLDRRISHIQEVMKLSRKESATFVGNEDLARKKYLKRYFKKDIDDPLLYDLVINTDRVSTEMAARLIAEPVLEKERA